jgi:glycosyltransferase involved in cell wall biosynthesis
MRHSMNFLFVHNNFPGQFRNLVEEIGKSPSHKIVAIGAQSARLLDKVALYRYEMPRLDLSWTHPFARRFDAECRRAEQVLFAASELAASGFSPDFIVAHCGWGETLPLRAIFPKAKIVIYCEYFYRAEGQDVHFDPDSPTLGADGVASLHCKNASTLIALAEGDAAISPTHWQKSTFPKEFHKKISVVHEGVDLEKFRPNEAAIFTLPGGKILSKADEIVTFASRNLEPMRGYHVFLRAVPDILKARPNAHVIIAGGDGCSYSHAPPSGKSWKTFYLDENLARLDLSRVHFVGRLPHEAYLKLLQVSSAHVYLTYPFVLSWSLLEAMATGCEIVASDTAPVREVIENEDNGVLVPFHERKALSDMVARVLGSRHSSPRRGRAARATVAKRYDKNVCVQETLRLMGIPGDVALDEGRSNGRTLQQEHAHATI